MKKQKQEKAPISKSHWGVLCTFLGISTTLQVRKQNGGPLMPSWYGSVSITKEFAEFVHSLPRCAGDRPLSRSRIDQLKLSLARVQRPFDWAFILYNGYLYGSNGNHTSYLLSQLETLPAGSRATITIYHAETKEQIRAIYMAFDTPFSQRSWKDYIRVIKNNHDGYSSSDESIIMWAAAGLAYFTNPTKATPSCERADMLVDDTAVEFINWLYDNFKNKDRKNGTLGLFKKKFNDRGYTAAIYGTWLKDKEDAAIFWEAVFNDDSVNRTTTTIKLDKMVTIDAERGTGIPRKYNTHEAYYGSISAWNAWRQERSLKKIPLPPRRKGDDGKEHVVKVFPVIL